MKQLGAPPLSQTPSTATPKPRNCYHWVDQLQKLFPQTETPVTQQFIDGMNEIMCLYPEKVLARVCSATEGLCTKQKYLPSLFELKEALDGTGFTIHEEEVRRQIHTNFVAKPPEDPKEGCYSGPIEQIQPGDILHHSRFDEYRAFMREHKGIPSAKLWANNEDWKDSGQRPFQIASKPQPVTKPQTQETNPFEI